MSFLNRKKHTDPKHGTDEENVVVHYERCIVCRQRYELTAEEVLEEESSSDDLPPLPRCPSCKAQGKY